MPRPSIKMVGYNTGSPVVNGVYACRVPDDAIPEYCMDIFLMWFDSRWAYIRSDHNYRGEVVCWLGPLERRHH